MSKKRAFVKYTKAGELIPGSLIITTKGGFPKDGVYKEVDVDLCCDPICPECPPVGLICLKWKYIGTDPNKTIQGAPCGGAINCSDQDFAPGDEKCLQFVCDGNPTGPDWVNLGPC